jgi:repressor LexA
MSDLTPPQSRLMSLLRARSVAGEPPPTLAEICREFGFRSKRAASDLLKALERKGFIVRDSSARGIKIVNGSADGIPLLGSIPAGRADAGGQSAPELLTLDTGSFGIRQPDKAFAVKVRGDSMTGRQLFDGDIVLCDAAATPKHQDIVAALIDNETTLKTLILQRGRPWLRAENPRYPDLAPVTSLAIQGVVRGVIRFLAA